MINSSLFLILQRKTHLNVFFEKIISDIPGEKKIHINQIKDILDPSLQFKSDVPLLVFYQQLDQDLWNTSNTKIVQKILKERKDN